MPHPALIARYVDDLLATLETDVPKARAAGSVGHGIAKLLGSDPRKQMDDDLLRFKS
jgi:hypothetical protein